MTTETDRSQHAVFVYTKGTKSKVLPIEESMMHHKELVEDGWKHTSSLDPAGYIESLLNSPLYEVVESLKTTKFGHKK